MTAAQLAIVIADPFNPLVWRHADVTPSQLSAILSAIQAAGVAIGAAVSGGTAGRVLYVGPGVLLAQNAGLTYDPGGNGFQVINGSFTAALGNNDAAITGLSGNFSGKLGYSSAGVIATDGTRSVKLCDGTNTIQYVAGASGSWNVSPPTDVWVAIDRQAVLLKSLNGGTGP